MGDFLLDAVAQFLKGEQWLEPVNTFMHTHKLAFVGVVGPQESYSLQHHAIFVEFKDLAERLLEGIVQDLGCEPAAFVTALEEAVVNEAGGPKEEEVQLLVKTLLTYDDFHGFCSLMQSYVEWNAVPTLPPDESEVQAASDSYSQEGVPFDAKKYFGSPEWILQEVVARSLVDAQGSGQLGQDDEAYLPWAEAILSMKEFYQTQPPSDELSVEASTPQLDGAVTESTESRMAAKLKALETTLVHERLKVDLLVAQRLAERNAGMRLQMSALCQASGRTEHASADDASPADTTAEDQLRVLCDRMEAIQVELKATKKRCFRFKSVSQVHLDEIYLFLKEKVHFKHDLAQCETEIADFIFSRIQPSDSAIVPDLLQWLLLESEAHDVQQDVQSMSFLSPRAEAKEDDPNDRWEQQWSDADNAYFYLNTVTGESRWDPPMSKDGEPILGYWDSNNQWVPYAFLTPADTSGVDMTADSKSGDDSTADVTLLPLESKPWTPSAALRDIGSALESAQSTHRDFSADMMDVEASLQKVLQEHADESKKLEIALQVEHARQTQDIQRRKAQRRKERKMKKAVASEVMDAKQVPIAPPPPVELSGLGALSGCQINICLPEGGKFDLMNLLSEADERVRRERRADGKTESTPSSLNATSLRYLAEKIAPTSKLIEIEDV